MANFQFLSNHASTIILCVVLMWLVFNWREAVSSTKILKTMLDMSDGWKAVINKHGDLRYELVKNAFESLDKARLEATKLHEELRMWRSRNEELNDWNGNLVCENERLRTELYELTKALWIERNGPIGDDDVCF